MPIDDKNPNGTSKPEGWKKHKLKKFEYQEEAKKPAPDPNANKDLGMMNVWKEGRYPKEYKTCQSGTVRHELDTENLGRCLNRYTCKICKITWTVDSSG